MKDKIKEFKSKFIMQGQYEKVFVTDENGNISSGIPYQLADDIIFMAKMFLNHTLKDSKNITREDLIEELKSQDLAFEQDGLILSNKKVNTMALYKYIDTVPPVSIDTEEILKNIKNMNNVISVNTENSMNKLMNQFVSLIIDIAEENKESMSSMIKGSYTEYMNKVGSCMFDMNESLKPKELQKGENNYSLPDEIKKIISDGLLNAQQQNKEYAYDLDDLASKLAK